jgi:hypothetical protein
MEHGSYEAAPLLWTAGWLIALGLLFFAGLRIPLQTRLTRWRSFLFNAGTIAAAVAVSVLASVALVLHDIHVDMTREKIFTPSAQAMAVVDQLARPVRLTYFYRGQDPAGRRVKDVIEVMGRRNPMLAVRAVDPDREPSVAQAFGVRMVNAAILEAEGRKVVVQTTDEGEIAIGIQRVLREKVIVACFLEGHNELPMDNFEFHTHMEGIAGHSHDDASSKVIQTTGHGIGRLRRALEAQGYETRKVVLATAPSVPEDCQVLVAANPRTTFLPAESTAIETYLRDGGALFAMFDLGFALEPRLSALAAKLGVKLPMQAVVDPLSHYSTDAEMVAVAAYDPHPITKNASMSFYPGMRPLVPVAPASGVRAVPLLTSSRDSYVRSVEPVAIRDVGGESAKAAPKHGPQLMAIAAEGRLGGSGREFRAVIVGDGDFASNSFLPYLANGDVALGIVRWLVREERAATVSSRIPVPPMILLTGAQMTLIFVAVEILLPLAILAIGGFVWWRRR